MVILIPLLLLSIVEKDGFRVQMKTLALNLKFPTVPGKHQVLLIRGVCLWQIDVVDYFNFGLIGFSHSWTFIKCTCCCCFLFVYK